MTLENDPDVIAIREWLAKENYLPDDLSDLMIKKFLHSCYGSLEKTKQCIDRFCSGRVNMPEVYTARDPCTTRLQNAMAISTVTAYPAGKDEILLHHLYTPTLEKFDYYDVMKTFSIQADYWIMDNKNFPEGHIIVMDLKYITLRIIPKVNIFYLQKFLMYLLEAMPVRVKQVHIINSPSYYEKLFALVKPALPQDIIDLMSFHSTHEGLYSVVDKKYLPEEFGGEAESFMAQQSHWIKMIDQERKFFLNDNLWKADLTKKPKNNDDTVMSGSFRTLSID